MNDFVTSEPTLTPLIAGTTTLTVAATLTSTFGWPGNITAIIISFLLASLVIINKEINLFKRIIFYFINATTIFIIAMGLNSAGIALSKNNLDQANGAPLIERGAETSKDNDKKSKKPFFHLWF